MLPWPLTAKWLSVRQAAQALDCHPKLIRDLLDSGELEHRNLGRRKTRVSVHSLRAYIRARTHTRD